MWTLNRRDPGRDWNRIWKSRTATLFRNKVVSRVLSDDWVQSLNTIKRVSLKPVGCNVFDEEVNAVCITRTFICACWLSRDCSDRCAGVFKSAVCFWRNSPQWASVSSFTRFVDHKQRRTTVGRIPLDEWSARRRERTHNTHNRQTSVPTVGFEPTISACERPQTHASDHAATAIGKVCCRRLCLCYAIFYNAKS